MTTPHGTQPVCMRAVHSKNRQEFMKTHHSRRHVGDAEDLKKQRLKKIQLQRTITKLLFYVLCIAAICLVAFAVWAYIDG